MPYLLFLNSFAGMADVLFPFSNVWWSLATEVQFYLLLPVLPFYMNHIPIILYSIRGLSWMWPEFIWLNRWRRLAIVPIALCCLGCAAFTYWAIERRFCAARRASAPASAAAGTPAELPSSPMIFNIWVYGLFLRSAFLPVSE